VKVVILAGGLGTRLSEETKRIPKPMVTVGDKPILWHIMSIFARYGFTDFVVALGYRGYAIKEYFANLRLHQSDVTIDLGTGRIDVLASSTAPWRVTLVDTGLRTMTGGRLARLQGILGDERFFLTYGDGLADVNVHALLDHHLQSRLVATVTSVMQPARFGALDVADGSVLSFREKPPASHDRVNGGFFVMEPDIFTFLGGDDSVLEREPLASLASAGQLAAYTHDGFWQPMDTVRDREVLEALWDSGRAPWTGHRDQPN
jgi:glucose-1-phosphate cytidylyltransferase